MNIQCRKDIPEKRIKFWYSGAKKALVNESILRIVDEVYFTEGAVDALLLNQFGLPAVARLGGGKFWDNSWLEKFATVRKIYYIADNDDAGYEIAKFLAEKFGTLRFQIYVFSDKGNKYDTVDFFRDGGTKEEFLDRVHNNLTYSFMLRSEKEIRQNVFGTYRY